MRDVLASDGILMVVQGKDNLCGMMKVLDWGVGRDDIVPDKEHELQEGPELDCPVMACALVVFTGPDAEAETQLDQVGNVPGFWVGGEGFRGHDGLDNSQGDESPPLEWEIFDPISFELTGEVLS